MEIPAEWVITAFVNLVGITLAALGIQRGRKNGADLNGASKSLRPEMEAVKREMRQSLQIDQLSERLKDRDEELAKLRSKIERLEKVIAELQTEIKALRQQIGPETV